MNEFSGIRGFAQWPANQRINSGKEQKQRGISCKGGSNELDASRGVLRFRSLRRQVCNLLEFSQNARNRHEKTVSLQQFKCDRSGSQLNPSLFST
jgi:hypothetical protein